MRTFSRLYDESVPMDVNNADCFLTLVDDFRGRDALDAALFGDMLALYDEDGIFDVFALSYGVRSRKTREFLCECTPSTDVDFSHVEVAYR